MRERRHGGNEGGKERREGEKEGVTERRDGENERGREGGETRKGERKNCTFNIVVTYM